MPNMPSPTYRDTYPQPRPELAQKFERADVLRDAINGLKDANASLWNTIVTRLRTDWTYNSCGIEGSTLTRGETHFFQIGRAHV